jgi:hypothetical protein
MRPRRNVLALAALAVLAVSATATATASAANSAWKFNGAELSGTETIVGAATSSSLTIPGVTTTCKHFLYELSISNNAGAGKGEVKELPLYECTTNTKTCTVESIEAKTLPWPSHLVIVGSNRYIIIENVSVNIVYGGSKCALGGTIIKLKGTAGGLISNSAQTATFNAETFTATGTSLKVGSQAVEWNGVFPTEAFEAHRGQTLEAS